MATTVSQQGSVVSESSRRPQPQPISAQTKTQRAKTRSPNDVTPVPAKSTVINSILESFNVLSSVLADSHDDRLSDTTSRRSRRSSGGESFHSTLSVMRSLSQELENELGGGAIEPKDDQVVSSLSAFVRSPHERFETLTADTARRPSSASALDRGFLKPDVDSAQRRPSTAMSRERESYGRSKLSSASWVALDTLKGDQTDDIRPSSRRKESERSVLAEDSSQQAETPIRRRPVPPLQRSLSRAEQIIAKTAVSPARGPKSRLYLTDSPGDGDQPDLHAASKKSATNIPESGGRAQRPVRGAEESVVTPVKRSVEEEGSANAETRSTGERSTARSPIVDSIPTRTSSLRQQSESPGARKKKKDRKFKRHRESSLRRGSEVDSVSDQNSRIILDSSWADLGEEDETVKRIRELREQRNARMLDSSGIQTSRDSAASPLLNSDSAAARFTEPEAQERPEPNLDDRSSVSLNNTTTLAARREATISASEQAWAAQLYDQAATGDARDGRPARARRISDMSTSATLSPVARAAGKSATPTDTPLYLDYSYTKAVTVLQGSVHETSPKKAKSRNASARHSVHVPTTSAPQLDTASVETTPTRSRSKVFRKPTQDRFAVQHPDLPVDFDTKKARRKSLSEVRPAKYLSPGFEPPLPRRDSIEVAVDEFLFEPRLNQKVKNSHTGRLVSFSEVGDPNGAAVFICVGMGLTRFVTAFYDELATTLRLRLITVDRPGVGNSEPYPAADKIGPLDWPKDVLAICQHLGVKKFSMLAHSAGAIYALATALTLPHFVQGKLHLLGPWIPPSQLEAPSSPAPSIAPTAALPRSQRFLRILPTPFLRAANASFMTATSASISPRTKNKVKPEPKRHDSGGPPSRGKDSPRIRQARPTDYNRRESMMLMDRFMPNINPTEPVPTIGKQFQTQGKARNPSLPVLSATATPMDPSFEYAANALNAALHTEKERKVEYVSRLTQRTWELATRDSNPATDLLVCLERHREIGFRYTDVHCDVVITHGAEDKRVPLANVKWLADRMNRRIVPSVIKERGAPSACELRVLQGEGHGLMASPTIMGNCLTEIAGYWNEKERAKS